MCWDEAYSVWTESARDHPHGCFSQHMNLKCELPVYFSPLTPSHSVDSEEHQVSVVLEGGRGEARVLRCSCPAFLAWDTPFATEICPNSRVTLGLLIVVAESP